MLLTAHRLLLLYVIRPSIHVDYGGQIWEGNKCQVAASLFWDSQKDCGLFRLKLVMKQ